MIKNHKKILLTIFLATSSSLFSMSPETGKIVGQNLAPYRTKFKNHAFTMQDVSNMYSTAINPSTIPQVSFYLFCMLADYSLQEKNLKPASFCIKKAVPYYDVLKNFNMLTEADEKNFSKLRDEIEKMYLAHTNQKAVSLDMNIKNEEENNNAEYGNEIFTGLHFNNNSEDIFKF